VESRRTAYDRTSIAKVSSHSDPQEPQAPFQKLRPGPGLRADAVASDQRRRLREAMTLLVADRGYDGVTVRGLSQVAGISTRTFYRHFENLEGCFGYVYESTVMGSLRQALKASRNGVSEHDRLAAGIRSMMEDVAARPAGGRLILIDAFDAGSSVRARMRCAGAGFGKLLGSQLGDAPRAQVQNGLVAGLMRISRKTTMAGRTDTLPGLSNEMATWVRGTMDVLAHRPRWVEEPISRRSPRVDPFPSHAPSLRDEFGIDDRGCILSAVARICADDGFEALTVARIRSTAGLPRRRFGACFDSVSDAYFALVDRVTAMVATRATGWAEQFPEEERSYRLMTALCGELARNAALAKSTLVRPAGTRRDGLLHWERLISRAVDQLDPRPNQAQVQLEASVAATWTIVSTEVAAGRATDLPQLAPVLAGVLAAGESHLQCHQMAGPP
jgi:AcrR family transcriptional regulator